MTEDLVSFLRERLDEDERIARTAGGIHWFDCDHVEHHERWDDDRVLREVDAKRRVLHRYEDCLTRLDDPDYSTAQAAEQAREYVDFVLPALAQPYSDHPDYRQEWAP